MITFFVQFGWYDDDGCTKYICHWRLCIILYGCMELVNWEREREGGGGGEGGGG